MTKNIKKRLSTLLLAAMLVFSFAACGKTQTKPQEPTPESPEIEQPIVLKGEAVDFEVLYYGGFHEPEKAGVGFDIETDKKLTFQSKEALDAYHAHLVKQSVFSDFSSMFGISDDPSYFGEKMVLALFWEPVEIKGKAYGEYELKDVRTENIGGKTKYYVYFDYVWTKNYERDPASAVAVPTMMGWETPGKLVHTYWLEVPASEYVCNEEDVEVIIRYVEVEKIQK